VEASVLLFRSQDEVQADTGEGVGAGASAVAVEAADFEL
jgi:hypothetical protein